MAFKVYISLLAFFGMWVIIAVLSKVSDPTQKSPPYMISIVSRTKLKQLAYPKQPVNSYCALWFPTKEKTYWIDVKGGMFLKMDWKELPTQKEGWVLNYQPYLEVPEWKYISPGSEVSSKDKLFLIPRSASMIYTRRYSYFKNNLNLQTARIGIDYACPGQILNHIPGASAFCRKDFLQSYLLDYQRRYQSMGLGHCYPRSITPQSFILSEPDHCQVFINELSSMLLQYPREEFPLKWILKSAVQHQGYGVKLLDYDLANFYKQVYAGSSVSCNNVLNQDKAMVAQQYISNPALIEGRKFDFRVFVAVANADPLVALWSPQNGHTRLSDQVFNATSKDFTTHITADVGSLHPEAQEFLNKYRFNLKELAYYFHKQLGDPEKWLSEVAYPQIKELVIHMLRATQQNFLVKRKGFAEIYGVDFILDDSLNNIYLLEANRMPNLHEKNRNLQFRYNTMIYDFAVMAEHMMESGPFDPDQLYWKLVAFEPLVDETKKDPYFGVLEKECSVPFKEFNADLPIDPMLEPLWKYVNNPNAL